MNRNRLILIGLVAVGLAIVVSMLMYQLLHSATTAQKAAPAATVVIAANDLAVGAKLEEKDLRLAKYPASDLPPGTFASISEVVGRGVIVPLTKNEMVTAAKVAGENAGAGMPALIPPGMRGVSVKVNDVISVAGYVTAGTRVDVILTGNPTANSDPSTVTTTTVLQNIQVLAAGQKLQRNGEGEPQQVTVITLLVTPEDAQKLTLASAEGRIQLSLRNPLDTSSDPVPTVKNAALYRVQPGGADVTSRKPAVHFAKSITPPTPPAPYVVEMIRGNDRNIAKF